MLSTTAMSLPGYRPVRCLGVVRGLVVRSRDLITGIGASLQSLVGGNITLWTQMCEEARAEAFEIMVRNAEKLGANAVLGVRYDSGQVLEGCTEVLAYGTAVIVESE